MSLVIRISNTYTLYILSKSGDENRMSSLKFISVPLVTEMCSLEIRCVKFVDGEEGEIVNDIMCSAVYDCPIIACV